MNRKLHAPYNRFKGWLRENNVTYAALAEKMGLNVATVSAKINGNSDFTLSEFRFLNEEYGVTSEIFLA